MATEEVQHENLYVIALPGMTEKWRKDNTIALGEVVDSFNVYVKRGGSGKSAGDHASKAELFENTGVEDRDAAVKVILEKGTIKPFH